MDPVFREGQVNFFVVGVLSLLSIFKVEVFEVGEAQDK